MRISSQRRSRSFTTSTPLALRSVSTPTHKVQRKAWPCHSSLSPSLFLFCLSICLSTIPSRVGDGWRLGPSPLLMSLVRHMTMSSGETSQKPLQSQAAFQMKKKPLYLSHGWCCGSNYGSSFILDTSWLVLIVILV